MSASVDIASADLNTPSVLWKAFDVLDAFDYDKRILTLSEVSRRSGLPKSTVHRILAKLLEVRAVERAGNGYRVGLRMFSMGMCSAEVQVRDYALPHLERLRRLTRQTVHLAVLDSSDVVYLEKLCSSQSPITPAVVGGRLNARSTGVGKALLAFGPVSSESSRATAAPPIGFVAGSNASAGYDYAAVRRSGIAGDREGTARGLACIAAPILVNSEAIAAVSVSFTANAGSGELFVGALRETSAAIGRALVTASTVRSRNHLTA